MGPTVRRSLTPRTRPWQCPERSAHCAVQARTARTGGDVDDLSPTGRRLQPATPDAVRDGHIHVVLPDRPEPDSGTGCAGSPTDCAVARIPCPDAYPDVAFGLAESVRRRLHRCLHRSEFRRFDVEIANGARGSICAIGLSVVTDGQVAATYSWLCRPPSGLDRFEPGNSLIHGLTARDVAGQPTFWQRLGDMLDVIGDLPLIAHNAAFDIGALREASAAESLSWRPLTYGCTVIWSRRELPELRNHKLPTVAGALGVPLLHHHDASADASAAAEIALELMRRRGSATVDAYAAATGIALGRATLDAATGPAATSRPDAPTWVTMDSASTPPEPSADADSTHPLFGQTVVITGALSGLSKEEAWAQLAKCVARVKKTVTRRTSVLVVGTWIDDSGRPAITEKHTQARRLREAGQQIAILNQAEMDALLTGDRSIAVPDLSAPSQVDAYALASDGDIAPNNRSDRQQQVRGRHFTVWVEPVKQLKREQRYGEALDLLLTEHARAVKALARQHQEAVWALHQTLSRLRSVLLEFYPAALQAFPNQKHKAAFGCSRSCTYPDRRPGANQTSPRCTVAPRRTLQRRESG